MELHMENLPRSVHFTRVEGETAFEYIDERLLPAELRVEETRDWQQVVDAIKTLAVRGAPAIGIAGAAAVALWCDENANAELADANEDAFEQMLESVANARPTAVNLRWAVENIDRVLQDARSTGMAPNELAELAYEHVAKLEADDERINRAIGANGAELIEPGSSILTHCNAGSLATAFYGTALGVVYAAAQEGKVERVYADETRPVGQGARLTVWELAQAGVPATLICDNMAASLMRAGKVQAVIVGADRVARNGDTANKIGTYGVAVLAHEHGIPFYVAVPFSTLDFSIATGAQIPIEERSACEVLPVPIEGVDVWNPAFDVTPARYITAFITERGVIAPEELCKFA